MPKQRGEFKILTVKKNGQVSGVNFGFANTDPDKAQQFPLAYGSAFVSVPILRELAKGDNLANLMERIETVGGALLAQPEPVRPASQYEYE